MKRWDCDAVDHVEDPKVDSFLDEVIAVCAKHGMSIAHEDTHGAFVVIRSFDNVLADWLRSAQVQKESP